MEQNDKKLIGAIIILVIATSFLTYSLSQTIAPCGQMTAALRLSRPVSSTSYYVDAVAGSDSNAGTSISKPWKTLAKLSSTTLKPGYKIYLKRGSVWNETLTLSSAGQSGKPIVIDAYGSGNLPEINGGGVRQWNIRLENASYLTIKNLHLTNVAMTPAEASLYMLYGSNITLDGLIIDGNKSSGIAGLKPTNLIIQNCQINDNGNRGIHLAFASNTIISGNKLNGNGYLANDSYAIDLIGSENNNIVKNNIITGEAKATSGYPNGSLRFDGDTVGDGAHNTAPTGNIMTGNNATGGEIGIQIINFSNAQISLNNISGTTLYGILIQAQPNGGTAINNVLSGNTVNSTSGEKAIYWNAGSSTQITGY